MRLGRRNKQKIKYALLYGEEPVYERDENGNLIVDYIESGGRIFYKITGEKQLVYSDPIEIEVNIAFNSSEIETVEYGVDISNYDATLIYLLKEFPITETSLVWFESEPTYRGAGHYRTVDPASADYKVLYVKNSLNFTKVLLGRLVK